MAVTTKKQPATTDPAAIANARILSARHERLIKDEIETTMDLGLGLKEEAPKDAVEFIRDEFDRKAFGDPAKTTTRTVFGPDPIISNCPEFHERLERYGLESYAVATRDLILSKGAEACPDPIMRKSVRGAIHKFGKEATAAAFFDRIMRIPTRVVEIELDGALDPLLVNPMVALVQKYGKEQMSVKFLSAQCNDRLGLRGYEITKDENGDVVKMGTLIMGQIPTEWAERRRQHFADASVDAVKEQEEAYEDSARREIASEGGKAAGASILKRGDSVHGDPAVNDLYTGDTRKTGVIYE
jgi:hypothetical protein